ncbi:MAG: hypothetical protein P4L50_15310 [Anaerolineaceae bacterium]|nr:hypothetical protein [Anaerolineaceae bacterium]
MNFEAVIKIGGSLARSQDLGVLCEEIGRLGTQHQLLVVPGGGEFADTVRDYYRRFQLSETTAHRMAILAMDQYGCLLGDLIPQSVLAAEVETAQTAAANGLVPILIPSNLITQFDPLPHSWQVTSDSIAAWIAGQVNASQLILLKVIDGVLKPSALNTTQNELVSDLYASELEKYPGYVDEYFSNYINSVKAETWVINGLYPSRLVELITKGQTIGTRIRRDELNNLLGGHHRESEH